MRYQPAVAIIWTQTVNFGYVIPDSCMCCSLKPKDYVTRQMTNFPGCRVRNTNSRLIPQCITKQDGDTPAARAFPNSSLLSTTFIQDLPQAFPQAAQFRKQSCTLFNVHKSQLLVLNTVSAPLPSSSKKHVVKEHNYIFTPKGSGCPFHATWLMNRTVLIAVWPKIIEVL